MAKFYTKILGILLVIVGVPIFILPIPFGFVLIGVGVALICGRDSSSLVDLLNKRKSSGTIISGSHKFITERLPFFGPRLSSRATPSEN